MRCASVHAADVASPRKAAVAWADDELWRMVSGTGILKLSHSLTGGGVVRASKSRSCTDPELLPSCHVKPVTPSSSPSITRRAAVRTICWLGAEGEERPLAVRRRRWISRPVRVMRREPIRILMSRMLSEPMEMGAPRPAKSERAWALGVPEETVARMEKRLATSQSRPSKKGTRAVAVGSSSSSRSCGRRVTSPARIGSI